MGHTKKNVLGLQFFDPHSFLAIEKTCSSKQVFCQHPVSEWNGMEWEGLDEESVLCHLSLSLSRTDIF